MLRGGGIYATGGSLIVDSQILDNVLTGVAPGGGIYAADASVVIRNCLIAGNTTEDSGGGVYLANGTLESSTIADNSAALDGGGVYRSAGTVINSIVYFNTVAGVPGDLSTTAGVSYTCASDGNTSDGNKTGDPLFVDLAGGDYRLGKGSPCIDAGDTSAVSWAVDLDGNERIMGDIIDMGAYEFRPIGGSVFRFR